jgi:hypothetical protein
VLYKTGSMYAIQDPEHQSRETSESMSPDRFSLCHAMPCRAMQIKPNQTKLPTSPLFLFLSFPPIVFIQSIKALSAKDTL